MLIITSCSQTTESKAESENTEASVYTIQTHLYDSMSIPDFFRQLVSNHSADCFQIDSNSYSNFCDYYELNSHDSSIFSSYYTIEILHLLFTSLYASDCSRGPVLNIPYLWHWITPNPRHEIFFVKNNKLLSETKPPADFSKYNSYADIDRTPYLFLSDLLAVEAKYYSAQCGTFSTFGWCSEREMAFVSLLTLLNFNGKVIAENNHSWSEFIVPMTTKNHETINFKITVDNTFDRIEWLGIDSDELNKWKNYKGINQMANWYNQKALGNTELQKISNHIVSPKAMHFIDQKLVDYFVCINNTQH